MLIILENNSFSVVTDNIVKSVLKQRKHQLPPGIVAIIESKEPLYKKIISASRIEAVFDDDGKFKDVRTFDTPSIQQLEKQLQDIDFQSIRPLRAVLSGKGTKNDENRLAELEIKAAELRKLRGKAE